MTAEVIEAHLAAGSSLPDRVAVLSFHTSPIAPLGGRETGGMNVYVREVSRQLARSGVAVDVFTRHSSPDEPQVRDLDPGVRLVQIDAGPAARIEKEAMIPFTAAFAAGVEAFRAAEGREYDLIHSHYWLSAEAGDRLAEDWNVPHIAMFHTLAEVKLRARASESEPPERLEAERRIVHHLDRIVAATDHERALLRDIYRVHPEWVRVVPLGVDLDHFRPLDRVAARARVGFAPHERVILAVGRLEPLKGLDILIRAVAAMQDRHDVVIAIIGGDDRAEPERARLQAVAEECGVTEHVRFLGSRPHDDLPDYYNAADVVAIPSFYESFGLVAVEAMACGTPVVASRVGGLASTVIDGCTGYLVPWRSPERFAEPLERLLRDEFLRCQLGAAAARHMQSYSWDAVATQVADVYAELVEERRAASAS